MRRFLISLLLASAAAAAPALAEPTNDGPHSGGRWQQAHEGQGQAHQEHQQARSGNAQVQNSPPPVTSSGGPSNDGPPRVRSFTGGANMGMQGGSAGGMRGVRVREADQDTGSPVMERHIEQGPSGRPTNWRMHERQAGGAPAFVGTDSDAHDRSVSGRRIEWRRVQNAGSGGLVQPDKPLPRVLRTRIPVVSDTPREGTQPPPRTDLGRRHADVQWSTNWRHSSRYDWWGWRRTHHSFFHLGLYYDPFGWGYQPYEIGWRLWPAYYSSRYWISDPWYYRLPYAPPGYRWVRYYDDLLLVDTWNGEVVDVIRDFFW